MASDISRIVNTTINDYIKGEVNELFRTRRIWAMLNSKGLITYGHGGDNINWKVRFKQATLSGFAYGDTISFAPVDRWKSAELPYRGYQMSDALHKIEKLKNRTKEGIVKYYSDLSTILMKEFKEKLPEELYVDGNATGNTKRFHGLESFFSVSGASASAPIGTNNDTYAGLSTALGGAGGSWSGNWPSGTGDAHYDYFTPIVVDYTSAVATASGGWTSSTATWAARNEEVMAWGFLKAKMLCENHHLDVCVLDNELFRLFAQGQRAKEQINISRGDGSSGLVKLGFNDVLNLDGVDITTEYGVPATVGYGLPMDQIECRSMQDELIVADGPDYDIASKTDRFSMDLFGNLRFETVKGMLKFDNVT